MTDPVKAKIIELVPEIQEQVCPKCSFKVPAKESGYHACGGFLRNRGEITERPITLADVLRAIAKSYDNWHDESYGVSLQLSEQSCFLLLETNERGYAKWNLLEPYDNQTQEVKHFIGTLIGVTD